MRKNSKIIWLWLSVCLLILGLVSCKSSENNNSVNSSDALDDNVIYSRDVDATLILGDGVETDDISSVRSAYYRTLGKEIEIIAASDAASHEIIIGKTDRPLSEKAYRYLTLRKKADSDVGYVIYSDEKSVAIAFDEASFGENVAFSEAIRHFVSNYMQKDSLKLSSGAVFYDSFDPVEKQQEIDEANTEELWELKLSQISAKIEDEETAASIIKELKAFHHIYNYDYEIVKWLANLYDTETGGFYYSNSARNNQGYLPDLESTSGAIAIVESILMGYGGTLTDYFGEEIAYRFVSFAKDMQQSNGYFYHPQWTPKLIDANPKRRIRDMLNALNILEYFGASPVYDTPNGIKGEGLAAPVSRLSAPLSSCRAASAVQFVSSSLDEIYIPPHLKSKAAFEDYLSGLNIREDTREVCETLSSEISLYIAIDEILEEQGENYRLCNILEKYLDGNQNTKTGLWGYASNVTYKNLEELPCVVKLYDGIGVRLPDYNTVLNTVQKCIKFEEEVDEITDISTVWSALATVVNNIIAFGGNSQSYETNYILNSLYANFDDMLKATVEKMLMFLRDDGSFSTTPEGSASEVLGMPVAVPLMEEGDMNATLLATNSIWLAVFKVLDIGNVPIFTTSDRMMFGKTLSDLGVIIKNEVIKTPPLDFENDDIGTSPGVTIEVSSTGGTLAEVVATDETHGNALRLYSPADRKASSSDKFNFAVMSEVKSASCFSFKIDMCVTGASSGEDFAHLMLAGDVYAIGLNLKDDTIRFFEETSAKAANSYTQDLGIRAKLGEWFTLRVEYYPGTAETVRIKIYFSSESVKEACIAVTDNYYDYNAAKYNGIGVPKIDCKGFAIHGLWGQEMDVLIDNLVVEKTYKTYTAEDSPTLNRNIDAPEKTPDMQDFESTDIGFAPSEFVVLGNSSAVLVTKDENNNKLLKISESAGEIILPLEQIGSDVNSALIEFDIIIPGSCEAGAKYQISFNEYLCNERTFGAIQLIILDDGESKYACLAEVVSGKTGTVYSGVKLYTNEKYRLSFRIFFEENSMVISVGEDIIGISTNVLAGCKKYYMGETSIKALTPDITSTILIDNLVSARIRSEFDEVTEPKEERDNYTFDSEEGMTLTGVTLSDGTLSFNGNGINKEVKIPVKTRVNVPTMAFVGFDVKVIENSLGTLTVTFADKTGNIIAAFNLVLRNSGVDIYECTKNGQYSKPIHRVSKSSFNFSIEYSAEKESFNLLVDGEYVAASSLIYAPDSGTYDFGVLSIGTRGSAGFVIDNLYAEKSYGILGEHDVSMENTDELDSVNTYETSSFASLPTSIKREFGSTASYFKIREGSILRSGDTEATISKVLEFYTSMGSTDYATFKRTFTEDGTNAAFFETDIMLQMVDGNRLSAELCLQAQVSGTPSVYTFNIIADKEGDYLKIKGNDFSEQAITVKEGEWFTLRLEYRDTPDDFNYDGKTDCLFRAYINGVQLGKDGHTANNTSTIQPYDKIHQLRFASYGSSEGKIYFDNTSLGQCKMEYTAPIEPDTHTITNTPGVVTQKTDFTFGTKNSAASVVDMNELSGEVGKVLKFHSAKNSADKLEIGVTQTLEGATGITFETDIMISPESGTSVFYLEPVTADGKQPFRLTIKATVDGDVTLTNPQNYGEEIPIGKSGEWIHLRVDYMNPRLDYDGDRRADLLYKIYTGEGETAVLRATGYKLYKTGAYYDPEELTDYVFTVTQESNVNIYLDNTKFWQTPLIADEAPEYDYTEEDSYGGSGSDSSAWTE